MGELTAPDSTSVGITRLGRDAAGTVEELGPLAGLVGTWMGSHGWEMIAVPTESGGQEGFRLIVRPYVETITFSALGAPVPNRGGPAGDMFIAGLLYTTRISDLETNEPLHLENGMWLYLGAGVEQPIARQASIPHGDAFLALGTSATTAGPPQIPTITGVPDAGPDTRLGYTDVYLRNVDEFQPSSPNDVLQQAISGLTIVQTIELSASTQAGGGISNIPFVASNANATAFDCTFWLETVQDPTTGNQIQQLQYSQQTNIEFLPQFGNPGQLIMWPHVNVNTLLKQ
jgi:hypothetical protein